MKRAHLAALLIAIVAFLGALYTALAVYDAMPHIEDEMAFVWQARVIARGQLGLPTPEPCPRCFFVPFVLDHAGLRFGKYPLGWPALLALGERLGGPAWVNPLLTGLTVWLIYRLGRKLFDALTALIAAGLAALSPFVWMNGGSLLSHPWALLLAVIFCLGWLDAFTALNPALPPRLARSLPLVTSALALGTLALTRPLTAAGVALPFAFHGLWLLARGGGDARRRLAGFVLIAGAVAALHFLWQYAVTGDPLLNPYRLWWPYDTVGFGPGVGLQEGGYLPAHAWANMAVSLHAGASDLFGWPGLSWLFLLPGLWALIRKAGARQNGARHPVTGEPGVRRPDARDPGVPDPRARDPDICHPRARDPRARDPRGLLIAGMLPALVLAYALYWIGSWVYGPRYYYEALLSPLLLTAVGVRWLAGCAVGRFARLRRELVTGLVIALVGVNLFSYLPRRLGEMRALHGFSAECLRPFQGEAARRMAPALVVVHPHAKWSEYACPAGLTSPFLDSDFVVVLSRGPAQDEQVVRAFPNRDAWHYYPLTGDFVKVEK